MHDAVVAAGYDRTFDEVPADGGAVDAAAPAGGGVRVDGYRVELDEGVRIDLGGIAKGYAAERAAELLAVAGPCLVSAGGDIATRGGSWPVGVDTGSACSRSSSPELRSQPRAATAARGGAAAACSTI